MQNSAPQILSPFTAQKTFENFFFIKRERTAVEGGISSGIRVLFMTHFYFDIAHDELLSIGDYAVSKHTISFAAKQGVVDRKFMQLLLNKLHTELRFTRTGTRTIFVDHGPLIGARRFGIIDSDTNCIEIRPVTGCNLNCTYCSVDEGIAVKKRNYLIDRGLLVQELTKLCALKKSEELLIHISSQGEPLLYGDTVELVREIKQISKIKEITICSNGTFLTPQLIDDLVAAGLTRYNISINAIDPEIAKKVAGCDYNIERVKEIARYLAKKVILIVAPTMLHGINEGEMPKIIQFCKEIGAHIGIQNFLEYKRGRNPTDSLPWEQFEKKMQAWEKEFDVVLLNPDYGFVIRDDAVLHRPFVRGDIVTAEYLYPGYVKARGRLIHVLNLDQALDAVRSVQEGAKVGSKIKIQITGDKYNTFTGKII